MTCVGNGRESSDRKQTGVGSREADEIQTRVINGQQTGAIIGVQLTEVIRRVSEGNHQTGIGEVVRRSFSDGHQTGVVRQASGKSH